MILVGDSSGITHSLKLSPNLRCLRNISFNKHLEIIVTFYIVFYRKQNKETLKAVREQDHKLAYKLEVKKLEILLQQMSQNKNEESDDESKD